MLRQSVHLTLDLVFCSHDVSSRGYNVDYQRDSLPSIHFSPEELVEHFSELSTCDDDRDLVPLAPSLVVTPEELFGTPSAIPSRATRLDPLEYLGCGSVVFCRQRASKNRLTLHRCESWCRLHERQACPKYRPGLIPFILSQGLKRSFENRRTVMRCHLAPSI